MHALLSQRIASLIKKVAALPCLFLGIHALILATTTILTQPLISRLIFSHMGKPSLITPPLYSVSSPCFMCSFTLFHLSVSCAAEYAKLPLIPAYLKPGNNEFRYGVSFASGGAGALVETFQGYVIDLKTQVNYFKKVEKVLREKHGDAEAKKIVVSAVYFFGFGGNDYGTTNVELYSQTQYVDIVIGNLTSGIREIYNRGGRKFVLQSMGPVGCLPAYKVLLQPGECNEAANELALLHNMALTKALQKLEEQLHGFKYSNFNPYNYYIDLINNPSKYGFKFGEIACCGTGAFRGINNCGGMRGVREYELCSNPSEYAFFDSNHPSDMFHQLLAQLMWQGTPDVVTGPYKLKQLFED